MEKNNSNEYRDLSSLSGTLKIFLGLYIVISFAAIWSESMELDLLNRAYQGEYITDEEIIANDDRQAFVGGLYFLIFLITSIIFLRWKYISNKNARSMGIVDMEFTPGWSVGWYFIPIANLWKPYHALKEIFKASNPEYTDNWKLAEYPSILPLWWILWLLTSFIGNIVLNMMFRTETIEQFITMSWLYIFSDILGVPLGIIVITLVSKLQEWQSAKYHQQVFVGHKEYLIES